ncbi:hypothetical protein P9597_09320 [Aneurinibacillus migulanus]|uniref:hypothetical protein n=1 Tax=Aneurinibacillus migulanus TaxID=47500 RepID=UPI002E22D301|nr:hypothetical protein [Aneurinibacillus migulanus]
MNFSVRSEKKVDSTKTHPFMLKVWVEFKDKKFQKRMSNICKESGYRLRYNVKEKNEGSIFKPNYVKYPEFQIINETQLLSNLIVESLIPTPFSLMNRNEGIPFTKFWGLLGGYTYEFESEPFRDCFDIEIIKILTAFIEGHVSYYEELKEKES